MLTIHHINPTGMFSYGESKDIELEGKGLVYIRGLNKDSGGDSNGSGKSSLFNSLCEILFGQNPTGVSGEDTSNNLWESGICSRVEFTAWENIRCRVTLTRKWKDKSFYPVDNDNSLEYGGTSLYFDKFLNGVWVDQRQESMVVTRNLVLNSVGLTYSQFLSIAYMSPRVGNAFLKGSNRDRIQILSGIINLEEWDTVLESSRSEKKTLVAAQHSAQLVLHQEMGVLTTLQSSLVGTNEQELRDYIVALDTSYASDRVTYSQKETEKKKVQIQSFEKLAEKDKFLQSSGLMDLDTKLLEEKNKLLGVKIPRIERDEVDPEKRAAVHDLNNSIFGIQGQVSTLEGDTLHGLDVCPTCGSKITKKKKGELNRNITELKKGIIALEKERDGLKKEIERDEVEIQKAYELEKIKVEGESKSKQASILQMIESINTDREEFTKKVAQFELDLSKLKAATESIQWELDSLENNMKATESRKKETLDLLSRVVQLKESISASQLKISKLEEECRVFDKDISIQEWLISNIPYIKLHKLSLSLEELTKLTNQYLTQMGDTVRVQISSFKEKKKSKGTDSSKDSLKSEVNVRIFDGEKDISSKLYSDGEMSKISNAFIRAMYDLANKFGLGCNIIMLDEIFSFIDANNSQKLAESFYDGKFGSILITDNSGMAENLLNFDKVWTVTKLGGCSTLEI